VTTTSYTDTSVSNGTTYYYKVTALNSAGEGALSSEASATPEPTAPGAPTLTASTSTTKGVILTWNAPPANGSAILQYVLYRSTSPGLESTYVTSCATHRRVATTTTAHRADTPITTKPQPSTPSGPDHGPTKRTPEPDNPTHRHARWDARSGHSRPDPIDLDRGLNRAR